MHEGQAKADQESTLPFDKMWSSTLTGPCNLAMTFPLRQPAFHLLLSLPGCHCHQFGFELLHATDGFV